MQTINFSVPSAWEELTDQQLRYVYDLIALDFATDEVLTLCLFKWSATKVVGLQENSNYLLRQGNATFEVSPVAICEVLTHLEWLGKLPPVPVRLSRIGRHKALPSDFSEVPFETYIMVDNLYQGYLRTQSDDLLDQLAAILYNANLKLKPEERVSVFYWVASLKDFFARRYPDFFQPAGAASDDNLLGSSEPSVEDLMNAQIRALTKGDVTKEREILALDTWRALTELNAQAKEYKEFNAKYGSKT